MVIDVTEPQPHLIEWNRSRWNTAAKQIDATTEDAKKKMWQKRWGCATETHEPDYTIISVCNVSI